jgi:hypothetical protein
MGNILIWEVDGLKVRCQGERIFGGPILDITWLNGDKHLIIVGDGKEK